MINYIKYNDDTIQTCSETSMLQNFHANADIYNFYSIHLVYLFVSFKFSSIHFILC